MVRDHWIAGQMDFLGRSPHTREEARPPALGRLGCITGSRRSAPGSLSAAHAAPLSLARR